jgi:ESCRT-II complex subunit VPS22
MKQKCQIFKEKLEDFARKHKAEIIKNPEFRSQFNAMCSSVGVDPLACKQSKMTALLLIPI